MWVVLFLQSLSAPATQLSPLLATGNILLYCKRFPGCKRGEHQVRWTIGAGVTNAFGKELCLFQGFSCCRNLRQYFIRDKRISFGIFVHFPKEMFPKILGTGILWTVSVCVSYLAIPFLLLKKDECAWSWYLAGYPIHGVGVAAFV